MQAKQKVTLYLSPELHRRLKIRAAVDSEPMSELAEKALVFYLKNSELVDEIESSYGRTHRVYSCPSCDSSLVLRDGELVALGNQPGLLVTIGELDDEEESSKGEELVPCLK
ncbi:hypothetical protein NIES4071_86500 [Calothrix sp. NIES-4071]|nr:hypothetical protein NIES4071_86500 [Calothrix sp. NIES-4071]BAZ62917.1 hypothetical protein NIES4105_86430 [Calothrix sp. NIES-4105]